MFYIDSVNNNKIAVYDLNPEGKKTIFLVHGWPLSHKMFEYQVNVLVDYGYRVITMDLRGFGNSDATAAGYDYDTLATDLYYVIYYMGLCDITLVGFSMGGAIATRYMTLYKGYGVSKLCLWGAAVPSFTKTENNPYGVTIEYVNDLINQVYRDRPKLNKDFGNMLFATNVSEPLRNWFLDISNSASSVGEIGTAISLRDEDLYNELHRICVPTGIFHGEKDKVCNFGFAKIMHREIPNSRLFAFPNAGHAAFYDELDNFNKAFLGFIRK